jgi:hypothetical protein
VYIPLYLPGPFAMRSFFWVNGTSINASNIQMCIRTIGNIGTGSTILVQSTATNQGTASALQIVALPGTPPTTIPAGSYWLGIGSANAGSTFSARSGALQILTRLGYSGSATVLGVPSGVQSATQIVPFCGISRWDGTSSGQVY